MLDRIMKNETANPTRARFQIIDETAHFPILVCRGGGIKFCVEDRNIGQNKYDSSLQ